MLIDKEYVIEKEASIRAIYDFQHCRLFEIQAGRSIYHAQKVIYLYKIYLVIYA